MVPGRVRAYACFPQKSVLPVTSKLAAASRQHEGLQGALQACREIFSFFLLSVLSPLPLPPTVLVLPLPCIRCNYWVLNHQVTTVLQRLQTRSQHNHYDQGHQNLRAGASKLYLLHQQDTN